MNIYHLDVQASLTRTREVQHHVISQKGAPMAIPFLCSMIKEFLCLGIKQLEKQSLEQQALQE